MASNIETDYDSDTEVVPDFDIVDLENFEFKKGDQLVGGSWETIITHVKNPNISLKFALPQIYVNENGILSDIQNASKNGFYRISLNNADEKHVEFKEFMSNLEQWLVEGIVNNHEQWFGHMWKENGPFVNTKRPPNNVIKEMYHPIIDDDSMCARVHINQKKNEYEIQCMNSDMDQVSLESIKDCYVVPLVELKGIFMKPRGYNPDLVLRGLVVIDKSENGVTENTDYNLFHTPTDDENTMKYYDYATEDEDTSSESGDDIDLQEIQETTNVNLEGEVAAQSAGEVVVQNAGEVAAQNVSENAAQNVSEVVAQSAGENAAQNVSEVVAQSAGEVAVESVGEVAVQSAGEVAVESVGEVAVQNAGEVAVESVGEVAVQNSNGRPRFSKEKLEALMRAAEDAKLAAKQVESIYREYVSEHSSQ